MSETTHPTDKLINEPAPTLNVWEPGVYGWTLIPQ